MDEEPLTAACHQPGANAGLAQEQPHPLGRRRVEAAVVVGLLEQYVRRVGRNEELRQLSRPTDREVWPKGDTVFRKRRDELVAERLRVCDELARVLEDLREHESQEGGVERNVWVAKLAVGCPFGVRGSEAFGDLGVDAVQALRERLGENGEAEERTADVDELEPFDVMACCGASARARAHSASTPRGTRNSTATGNTRGSGSANRRRSDSVSRSISAGISSARARRKSLFR